MSKELKVGVFVLSSLLVFLATFVYVDQLSSVRIPYKTYFKYAGGVDPGSPVRFGGMKAGIITAIRPWRQDPTKIELLFEVKGGVPVNADSVATLTSLSPLGDKYLEITTGTTKARRLPPSSTIPSTEPVSLDDLARRASTIIPAVQSTLQDMQNDMNQLTANANIVLANAQAMTGPQNQQNLALLLANARDLLDKESPQIDRVLHNIELASLHANDALGDVRTAAQTANETFASANRAIVDIRDPIRTDLAELQETIAGARRLIRDLSTIVSTNRYNINDSFENLRVATANLRDLTSSVKERPWMLLRGKPVPDRPVPAVAAQQ